MSDPNPPPAAPAPPVVPFWLDPHTLVMLAQPVLVPLLSWVAHAVPLAGRSYVYLVYGILAAVFGVAARAKTDSGIGLSPGPGGDTAP